MNEAPDNHELARRFAVLEERMNTMQADLSATLERFRADMETSNTTFERLRADMAERDAARSERDAARSERDATARWWQTTIIIGAVAVALGVAGLIFG